MLVIIAISLIVLFGFLLVVILIPKMNFIEKVGLSFLLGLGLFTFLMFCYSTLGIRITFVSIYLSLSILDIILFTVCIILKRRLNFGIFKFINSIKKSSLIVKIALILLVLIGSISLLFTLYYPIYIWDALALYDFRAKVISEFGYFTQIANNYFYFSQYPLFTSLSHVIIYLCGGKNPQFIYSFLYISFLFVFYGSLREFVSRNVSLLCTILLSSVPVLFEHSTFAYTNLPYVIFITLGTIYMYIWIVKQKSIGYLILAGLLTALSTWSRSAEPFWAINVLVIFVYSIFRYKRNLLDPILYCLSFFPIKWIWLKAYYGLVGKSVSNSDFISSEISSIGNSIFGYNIDFNKLTGVLIYLTKNVIITWYPVLALFIFFFVISIFKLTKKISSVFLLFILLHFILLIYGTYIYSIGISYWYQIPDSARRMAMFFIPLMVFYIGLSLNGLMKNNRIQ